MPQLNNEVMSNSELNLDEERLEVFEQLIAKYERDWHRDPSVSWQDYLPEDSQLRACLIREFSQIEAEFSRRQRSATSSPGTSNPTLTPVEVISSSRKDRVFRSEANFQQVDREFRGGLGDVFVIRDVELNRMVVVKQLQARWFGNRRAERAFQREIEITSALEHPCIVPVHSVGKTPDGRPFYSMRYVNGQTLQQAIDSLHQAEKFDSDQFRHLLTHFIQICHAIAYANNRNIIHRDLKPSNILIGEFGQTLVLDWGLAKVLNANRKCDDSSAELAVGDNDRRSIQSYNEDDDFYVLADSQSCSLHSETTMGEILGTPGYMSPEQALGQIRECSVRTDVFGLGGVLFSLLTGKPPLAGRDASEAISNAAECNVDYGSIKMHDSLARGITAICRKAMNANPELRYGDAQSLAHDLEAWLAGNNIAIQSQPILYRLGRFLVRQRTLAAATIFFLIATIGAIVVGFQAVHAARTKAILAENDTTATRRASQHVAEYVAKVYRSADSSRIDDLGITSSNAAAREALTSILDNGIRLVNLELKQHPQPYSELLLSMGIGYSSVGQFEKADALLREAITKCTELYGPSDLRTLECRFQCARIDFERENYAEAEAGLNSVVTLIRSRPISPSGDLTILPTRNLLLANAKFHLGWLQFFQPLGPNQSRSISSRLATGERLFNDVIDLRRRHLPKEHRAIGLAYASLASVLFCTAGKETQASQASFTAMEILNASGEHRFDSFLLKYNLSENAHRSRSIEDAEQQYQELVGFIGQQLGENHPLLAVCRWKMVDFYLELGHLDKAESMITFTRSNAKLPPAWLNSALHLAGLQRFAESLAERQRIAEAVEIYEELLKLANERPAEHAKLIELSELRLEHLGQEVAKSSASE